jgi:hypothetical protein
MTLFQLNLMKCAGAYDDMNKEASGTLREKAGSLHPVDILFAPMLQ